MWMPMHRFAIRSQRCRTRRPRQPPRRVAVQTCTAGSDTAGPTEQRALAPRVAEATWKALHSQEDCIGLSCGVATAACLSACVPCWLVQTPSQQPSASAVDHRDRDGVSALMNAAAMGDATVVRWLLAAGARVDLRCSLGATALDYARAAGHGAEHESTALLLQVCTEQKLQLHPASEKVMEEIEKRRRAQQAKQQRMAARGGTPSSSASPAASPAPAAGGHVQSLAEAVAGGWAIPVVPVPSPSAARHLTNRPSRLGLASPVASVGEDSAAASPSGSASGVSPQTGSFVPPLPTFLGARVTPEGLRTLSMLTNSSDEHLGLFTPPPAGNQVAPGPRKQRSPRRGSAAAEGEQSGSIDWSAAAAASSAVFFSPNPAAAAASSSSDANGDGGFVLRDYFARSVPSTPPRATASSLSSESIGTVGAAKTTPSSVQSSPRSHVNASGRPRREPMLLPGANTSTATSGKTMHRAGSETNAVRDQHEAKEQPRKHSVGSNSGPAASRKSASGSSTPTKSTRPVFVPNPWKLFGPMRAGPAPAAVRRNAPQQPQLPSGSAPATPSRSPRGSGTGSPQRQGSPPRGTAVTKLLARAPSATAVGPSAIATADALAAAAAPASSSGVLSAASVPGAAIVTGNPPAKQRPTSGLGVGGGGSTLNMDPSFTNALQHTPSKLRASQQHGAAGASSRAQQQQQQRTGSPPPARRAGSHTSQELHELSSSLSSNASGVGLSIITGGTPSSTGSSSISSGGHGGAALAAEYENPMSPLTPISLEAVLARAQSTAAGHGAAGSPGDSPISGHSGSGAGSGTNSGTASPVITSIGAGGMHVPTSMWRLGSGLGMALRAHQPLTQQQRQAAQAAAVAAHQHQQASSGGILVRASSGSGGYGSGSAASSFGSNVSVSPLTGTVHSHPRGAPQLYQQVQAQQQQHSTLGRSNSASLPRSASASEVPPVPSPNRGRGATASVAANAVSPASSSGVANAGDSDVLSVRAAIEAMISPTERLGADVAFRNALLLALPYFTAPPGPKVPSIHPPSLTIDSAVPAPVPPPPAGQGVLAVAELLLEHLFRPSPAAVSAPIPTASTPTQAATTPRSAAGKSAHTPSPKAGGAAPGATSPTSAAATLAAQQLTTWRASKLRIFSVLKHWIKTYPPDFLLRIQPPAALPTPSSPMVASSFSEQTMPQEEDGAPAVCALAEYVHARLSLFPPASWPAPHVLGLAKLAAATCAQLEELMERHGLTGTNKLSGAKSSVNIKTRLPPPLLTSLNMAPRSVRARAFDGARSGREKLLLGAPITASADNSLEALLQNLHVWSLHRLRDVRSERELLKHQRSAAGSSSSSEAGESEGSETFNGNNTESGGENGGPLGRNQMKISNVVSLWVCTSLLTAGLTAAQAYPAGAAAQQIPPARQSTPPLPSSASTGAADSDDLPVDEPLLAPALTAARASVFRRVVSLAVRAALPPYSNWNLFFELLNALQVHAVHRLLRRGIEPALTAAEKAALPQILALTSAKDNYKAYRTLFAGGSSGASTAADTTLAGAQSDAPVSLSSLAQWPDCNLGASVLSVSRSFNGTDSRTGVRSPVAGVSSPTAAAAAAAAASAHASIKVPYLGVLFKDLVSLEDGQPPLVMDPPTVRHPPRDADAAAPSAASSAEVLSRQINVSKARALANMVFDALACKQLPTFPRTKEVRTSEEEDDDEDGDDGVPVQCPYPLAREEVQRALQESLEHSMSEAELNALSERIQPRRLPRSSTSVSSASGRNSAATSQRNSLSGAAGMPGAHASHLLLQRLSSSSMSVTRPGSGNSAATSLSRSSSIIRGSHSSALGGTASTAVPTPFSVSPSSAQHGSPSAIRTAVSDAHSDSSLFAQQPEERPRAKPHVPLLLAGITVDGDGAPATAASSLMPCKEEETTSPTVPMPLLGVPMSGSASSSGLSSAASSPLPTLRGELPDFQAMNSPHFIQEATAAEAQPRK